MNIEPISIQIYNFLKRYPKKWFFGGSLERRLSTYHKPSYVARQLRAMAEEELILHGYEKVKGVNRSVVKYKFKK